MRSTEEIQQRFNEVNAWRKWQLTTELAEDVDPEDSPIPPAAPAPIPGYMNAGESMSVPGVVRALAWALGGVFVFRAATTVSSSLIGTLLYSQCCSIIGSS